MKIILRVEHMSVIDSRTGLPAGPYSASEVMEAEHENDFYTEEIYDATCEDCIHSWMEGMMSQAPPHQPAPIEDGFDWIYEYMSFGFGTVESLMDWFNTELSTLERFGFVIGVYEVPEEDVTVGGRQLVFHRDTADRLGDVHITAHTGLSELTMGVIK